MYKMNFSELIKKIKDKFKSIFKFLSRKKNKERKNKTNLNFITPKKYIDNEDIDNDGELDYMLGTYYNIS